MLDEISIWNMFVELRCLYNSHHYVVMFFFIINFEFLKKRPMILIYHEFKR